MMGMDAEVEGLRATVSRHFSISQIVVNPFAVSFHITVDPPKLDSAFDALRRELLPRNYIPSIVREQSAYVIHVQKRPEPKFRGTQVNVLLLLVTIGTTWVAGAVNWQEYAGISFPPFDAFAYGFSRCTPPL